MAYEKTTWQTGDIITAEKMNNIENGIVNNFIEGLGKIQEYDKGDLGPGQNKFYSVQANTTMLIFIDCPNFDSANHTNVFIIDIDQNKNPTYTQISSGGSVSTQKGTITILNLFIQLSGDTEDDIKAKTIHYTMISFKK